MDDKALPSKTDAPVAKPLDSGADAARPWYLRRPSLKTLGPGLIAGAADDDPSGIATFSVTGAQFGQGLLWTAWFSWPLMASVQMMCARIGMVTGHGLTGALRQKFPKPVLVVVAIALFLANSINVGADLAGMADAVELLSGFNAKIAVVLLGIGIAIAVIRFRYAQIVRVLKWLTLILGAYVIAVFLMKPDWGSLAASLFTVSIPPNGGLQAVVAILGTTISPYLFFWQAGQEVEEEKAMGRSQRRRVGATHEELADRSMDVSIGTFISNTVMFFVITATALTLHKNGITQISTSREVAEALRPLAGDAAMLLYTLGIIGVGLLAIPTLAGSAAYAFCETFRWREGLDEKWWRAKAFYGVLTLSVLLGIGMDFLNINAITALFWTAVINGVLAPLLLIGVLAVARDRRIMHGQPSSRLAQAAVGVTILVMLGAAAGLLLG